MNFKEYDNFINNHKYDMLHFIIYYNLKCNDDFKKLNNHEIEKLIQFIHDVYLKDENNIDLAHICDIAMNEYERNNILYNEWTKWDLLEACYD